MPSHTSAASSTPPPPPSSPSSSTSSSPPTALTSPPTPSQQDTPSAAQPSHNDFFSPRFNARRLLAAERDSLSLPVPDAPTCASLSEFVRLHASNELLDLRPTRGDPSPPHPSRYHASSRRDTERKSNPSSRQTLGKRSREQENRDRSRHEAVLEDALQESFSRGPLSVLYKSFKEEKRVEVVIRQTTRGGIRGRCFGFVKAFDRHMNLVLSDVEDRYVQSEIAYAKAKHLDPALRGVSRGNRKRATFVKKEHKRRLPQLFIKGDSVVMVIVSSTTATG